MGEMIGSIALILLPLFALLCLTLLGLWLFRRVPNSLTYLRLTYLRRIPNLTILGVWFFCLAALLLPGTRSLLGNAFDLMGDNVNVGTDSAIKLRTDIYFASKLAVVSFCACLLGATTMVTRHLIRLYGRERFSIEPGPVDIDTDIKPKHLVRNLLVIACPIVVGVIYRSIVSSTLDRPRLDAVLTALVVLVAVCLGVSLSLIVLWFASWLQRRLTLPADAGSLDSNVSHARKIVGHSPDFFFPRFGSVDPPLIEHARSQDPPQWLVRLTRSISDMIKRLLPPDAQQGYIAIPERDENESGDQEGPQILPGHIAAFIWLLITWAIYLAIGLLIYYLAYLSDVVPFSLVPTLCYLILLAMLLCGGLSSLTFFFDRYRIPVLIPLVGLLLVASVFGPDYYYPTKSRTADAGAGAPQAHGKLGSPPDTMIVVAANGGGIQASAWTARVLTGLEEDCREDSACGHDFGKSIRLISSVSGGSVGTMYFLNEYTENGTLPGDKQALEGIVARAEGSSLDYIAWGLLYPDLAHTIDPLPLRLPGPFGLDRGQTLDRAWLRRDMEKWPNRKGIEQDLSQWQADAKARVRPGVIFNTTIVETGERLPLSTVPLPKNSPGGIRYKDLFQGIKPRKTIPVVTAARLSAAFPFVSPAARAKIGPKAKISQNNVTYKDHLVDGGYYDNYGMSSLVEWLNWKLEDNHKIKKVIVIQIISSPEAEQSHSACLKDSGSKSDNPIVRLLSGLQDRLLSQIRSLQDRLLFQIVAPAETALNVRGAGQSTHSEVERQLLTDKYERKRGLKIHRITFRFAGKEPPLSWHLTGQDKQEIQCAWDNSMDARNEVVEETKKPN